MSIKERLKRLERNHLPPNPWDTATIWTQQTDGLWRNDITGETVTEAELDRRPEYKIRAYRAELNNADGIDDN